ncbi:MAG: riboflavin biosynthesis protein RibF, partial [Marinirhabdus sp.]
MQEHPSAAHYNDPRPCIVTMGTFDGVHLGHRSILDRVVQSGKKLGMAPVLLTFFPHPRMVLQKENNLKLINTLSEKKELLRDSGLQHLIVQPFTVAFSKLTAREYARDILRGQLRAKKVIIGYDHRFGRDRGATIKDLRAFGKSFNFEVEEIPAKEVDAVSIS